MEFELLERRDHMNNADDRGAIDTHDLQVLHLMRRTRGKIGVTGLGWGDQRDREDGDIKSLRQTQGTRRASVMPLHRKVCRFIFECFSFNSLVRMDKSEPCVPTMDIESIMLRGKPDRPFVLIAAWASPGWSSCADRLLSKQTQTRRETGS